MYFNIYICIYNTLIWRCILKGGFRESDLCVVSSSNRTTPFACSDIVHPRCATELQPTDPTLTRSVRGHAEWLALMVRVQV